MKKIISILMAGMMILSLSACGQGGSLNSESSSISASSEALPVPSASSQSSAPAENQEPSQSLEPAENQEPPQSLEPAENQEPPQSSAESFPSDQSLPETPAEPAQPNPEKKTLIAYFSWSPSGNTAKMATYIQEQTGGDLLRIEPLNPYPTDYSECGEVAKAERDNNARPAILNPPSSLAEYDTILIGYPIWWHTAPMIIGTFLESYDLTGVEIYPFSQSDSMNVEQFDNSMDFIRETAAGATVHDGLFEEEDKTDIIYNYLEQNGLVAQ